MNIVPPSRQSRNTLHPSALPIIVPGRPSAVHSISKPQSSTQTSAPNPKTTVPKPASKRLTKKELKKLSSEETIAQLLVTYFSDDTLSYDRPIAQAIRGNPEGWVLISLFYHHNLGTQDEAVVSHAVRAHASADLQVSPDGRSLRRLIPIRSAEVCQEEDARTIYMERFQRNTTAERIEEVMEPFGALDRVILPPSERSIGHKYAFVVFQGVEGANRAVEGLKDAWVRADRETPLKVIQEAKHETLGYVRVMPKNEWIRLMDEYTHLLARRRAQREAQPRHEQYLEFERGIVARFSGVCRDTDRKTLRRLFQLLAPVEHIDFPSNSTT
ncbi:hypothetical protein HKX48_002495, partial [Thoreauomyces humboldtii]